ncbi:InlB B-repeat-containing protein [Alishewanella jeotgali]|nr:hypothetical protein [Alishewanella jeotgali]
MYTQMTPSNKLLLLTLLILLTSCGGGGDSSSGGTGNSPQTYVINTIAGNGGTITPASRTVNQGQSATFTVTADSGFTINVVTGCGGSLTGNTYTTGVINANCTVNASFNPISFTISATAGEGGTITPTSQVVSYGATTSFTVTPNTGYSINTVSGCGGSLTGNTYTTGPINTACNVNASFNAASYTITATAGEGGTITPTSQVVSYGATTSFTVTPNTGYSINTVSGCGGSINGNIYTTSPINESCSINAAFNPLSFTVIAVASDGGKVTPASQMVDYGKTATFNLVPDENYSIGNASGCGGSLTGNTYTTGPITQACEISVVYTPVVTYHKVTAVVINEGGFITPNLQNVAHGDFALFRLITDYTKFKIDSESGCDNLTINGDELKYGPITHDCNSEIKLKPLSFGNLKDKYYINDKPSNEHPQQSISIIADSGQTASFAYSDNHKDEQVLFYVNQEMLPDGRNNYILTFEPGKLTANKDLELVAKVYSETLNGKEFNFSIAINASPNIVLKDYPSKVFTLENVLYDASESKDSSGDKLRYVFYEIKNGEFKPTNQTGPIFSIETPIVSWAEDFGYRIEVYDEYDAYDFVNIILTVENRPPLIFDVPSEIVKMMSYDDIFINFKAEDLDGEIVDIIVRNITFSGSEEYDGTIRLEGNNLIVFSPGLPIAESLNLHGRQGYTLEVEAKDSSNKRTKHEISIILKAPWETKFTSKGCGYFDYNPIDVHNFESIYNLKKIGSEVYYSYYLQAIPYSIFNPDDNFHIIDGSIVDECGSYEEKEAVIRKNILRNTHVQPSGIGELKVNEGQSYDTENFYLNAALNRRRGPVSFYKIDYLSNEKITTVECYGFCDKDKYKDTDLSDFPYYSLSFYNSEPENKPDFQFDVFFGVGRTPFIEINGYNRFRGSLDIVDLENINNNEVTFIAKPVDEPADWYLYDANGLGSVGGFFSITANSSGNAVATNIEPLTASTPIFTHLVNNEKYIISVKGNCDDLDPLECDYSPSYSLMKQAGNIYVSLSDIEASPSFLIDNRENNIIRRYYGKSSVRLKRENLQVELHNGKKGVLTRSYKWDNDKFGRFIFTEFNEESYTLAPFIEVFSEINDEMIQDYFTFDANDDQISDFVFVALNEHNFPYVFSYMSTSSGYERINLGNRSAGLALSELVLSDSCHIEGARCVFATLLGKSLISIPLITDGLKHVVVINDRGLAGGDRMVLSDVCGNDSNDLVVTSVDNGHIYLYKDITNNISNPILLDYGVEQLAALSFIDTNNKGLQDLFVSSVYSGIPFLLLYKNNGCDFSEPERIEVYSDEINGGIGFTKIKEVLVHDLNDDGFQDIILTIEGYQESGFFGNPYYFLEKITNDGNGGFTSPVVFNKFPLYYGGPNYSKSKTDVSIYISTDDDINYLYVNTAVSILRFTLDNLSGDGELLFSVTDEYRLDGLVVEDINNDGVPEIIFLSYRGNLDEAPLFILEKDNNNNYSRGVILGISSNSLLNLAFKTDIKAIDLNNDSCVDLFIYSFLYLNNCSAGFKKGVPTRLGSQSIPAKSILFYDLDKDGDSDFIILSHTTLGIIENISDKINVD